MPPLPPSLVAGVVREPAASARNTESAGLARRQGRWRARPQQAAAAPVGARSESDMIENPNVERRRPASLRSIDESDPFK
jgi:hypothetical protein